MERQALLNDWSAATQDVDLPTLPDGLARQVSTTPDAVAVVAGEAHVSYQTLDETAEVLATLLRRRGVHREAIVAIALPRSIDAIVALQAALKAGAAYLPLDVELSR